MRLGSQPWSTPHPFRRCNDWKQFRYSEILNDRHARSAFMLRANPLQQYAAIAFLVHRKHA
jgi:hypothetical protein